MLTKYFSLVIVITNFRVNIPGQSNQINMNNMSNKSFPFFFALMALLMIANYPQIEAGYEFKYEDCTMWEDINEYCKSCYGPTCDMYMRRKFKTLSEETLVNFLIPYANHWQDNGKQWCTIKSLPIRFNSNVGGARKIKSDDRRKIVPYARQYPHKCLRYKDIDHYCLTCRDANCEKFIKRDFTLDTEEAFLNYLINGVTVWKDTDMKKCLYDPFAPSANSGD